MAARLGVSVDLVRSWRQGRLGAMHWLDHVVIAWHKGWEPPMGLRRHVSGAPSVWGSLEAAGFRCARVAAGLSQDLAARRAGVSVARWRSWEQGRRRIPAYGWALLSMVEWQARGSLPVPVSGPAGTSAAQR